MSSPRSTSLAPAIALAFALTMPATVSATVINIDASHGFTYDRGLSDPAPVPGQHINPIGARIELSLDAGVYEITNAFAQGIPGALFNAWSYNVGNSSWAWAFVVADASTDNVIAYYEGGGGNSAAQVAALPAVQSFKERLTLSKPTTLLFTLRDYYVPDNAGGVSLNIVATPVPEPHSGVLLLVGLAVAAGVRRWRFSLKA